MEETFHGTIGRRREERKVIIKVKGILMKYTRKEKMGS